MIEPSAHERGPSRTPPPGEGARPGGAGRLARSAGLIGIATMTSRVLGLARDAIFATLFGAGDQMDAFKVAFRIPNLVRDLFAEGAMSAAFVPTFTRKLANEGRESAWRLGNLVISMLVVVTAVIGVAGMIFAEPITRLFASSYTAVPGKFELTLALTRAMFPFLTLVAIAVAFMGMLNSLRHFFIPALSPALFNVAAIFSALAIVPVMPGFGWPPMMGLAIGVLIGGLLQVLVQWPSLHREGFRFRFELAPRDPGLRDVLMLMVPGTVGLAAVQVNVFVNTVLATGEGTGAVSWLDFAFRLMYLPIGLFGVSIATAAVPTIASYAARSDITGMRATVSSGLRMMLMLNVPATVGLIALATPIVALIYERGRFTPEDTAATAAALMCYAPGLVGYSAVKIASPTFYALRDSRTPVVVSVLSMVVNIVINLALVRVLGYKGLAIGTAAAAILNAGVLLWLLGKRLDGLEAGRVAVALVKITVASAVMALAAVGASHGITTLVGEPGFVARLLQVGGGIGAGLVVLAAMARLLRIAEFEEALGRVLARLGLRRRE